MIATYESLISRRFQRLSDGPGWQETEGLREAGSPPADLDYLGAARNGVSVILRGVEGNAYGPYRLRDRNGRVYQDKDIDKVFGNLNELEDLQFYLENPKWIGIDKKTRDLLIRIATLPRKDMNEAEELFGEVEKIIRDCKDPNKKSRIEWEMDGAATAHVTGNPKNYLNSKP